MKKTIKLFCLLWLLSAVNLIHSQNGGVFVNRVFQTTTGSPLFNPVLNPLGVQWSKSTVSTSGGIITVGYTSISGQGQNVFLVKHNGMGDTIFQKNFNTTGTNDDYGLGVIEVSGGDIYICGTTYNGSNYDALILRCNSSGNLLNSTTRNGTAGGDDMAVSLIKTGTGDVFVAGNTADAFGLSNMWLLKYSTSLSYVNSVIYDYAGLNDYALGLYVGTGGSIVMVGPSASGATACDYAKVTYAPTSLVNTSTIRNNIPGTALDMALDFCKDANDNTFITGKAWTGSNFMIKTICIDALGTIVWTATLNPYSVENVGSCITLDGTGNVIVGGYVTKTNNVKDLICIKYNASSGSLMWQYQRSSENTGTDAVVTKVCTNPLTDNVYITATEQNTQGFKQALITRLTAAGAPVWSRNVLRPAANVLSSDIKCEGNAVYAISVIDSVSAHYLITKFDDLILDTMKVNYGKGAFKKNELIVRFLPTVLDSAIIDNSAGSAELEFTTLKEILTPAAYSAMTVAMPALNRDVKAAKIFAGMSTNLSTVTSHRGENIQVPDFWTALLLQIPPGVNFTQAHTVFNNLPTVAAYAHPNWLAQLFSVPNDSLYGVQYALHSNTVFPNCDVNVEEAWDVMPSGGNANARVGILDTGIDWEHADFGYDGADTATSKIQGYSIALLDRIKSLPNGGAWDNHGTAVAGIIGAQRNNTVGLAGVAGGNDSTGSKGAKLFGVTVFDPGGSSIYPPMLVPLYYLATAVWISANNPSITISNQEKKYAFNVNIQNLSWGFYDPGVDTGAFVNINQTINLMKEVVHSVNRIQVTAIAARGNAGTDVKSYPANADDDWVINVTASGTDGNMAHNTPTLGLTLNSDYSSSWGGDVDLSAPGTFTLNKVMACEVAPPQYSKYLHLGGTSTSAPYVTGAAALLVSYLHDSANVYNNMAPEDVEAILQMTATDADTAGYDQLSGHGRLNIGKAMRKVEKPYHKLWHFGTTPAFSYNINKTLYSLVDTVRTTERWQKITPNSSTWFQKGKYIVKTYKINSTIFPTIGAQDTIIAYWPRHSSSVTWPLFNNGKLLPREKTKIIAVGSNFADLEGYIYEVRDSTGLNSLGWWPVDTSYVNTALLGYWAEYSVLTRNYASTGATGVKDLVQGLVNFSVYPNPTNNRQTLVVETDKVYSLSIDLFDIMGRKVKTVYKGNSNAEKTVVTSDLDGLPNSLYIYTINLNGQQFNRKVIKN